MYADRIPQSGRGEKNGSLNNIKIIKTEPKGLKLRSGDLWRKYRTVTTSYAIGIDIGGSALKCGVVDRSGNLLYAFSFPISNSYAHGENIALILAAIRKCAAQVPGQIAGVGIGFPGLVDRNVIIGGGDNLPGFLNVDLGQIISSATQLDVVVDNDVNMMGTGEQLYGAAAGCSDVVFITVGTGIAAALLLMEDLTVGIKTGVARLVTCLLCMTEKPAPAVDQAVWKPTRRYRR